MQKVLSGKPVTQEVRVGQPLETVPATLPLPLTTYEYYMYVDDRPSHPMTFAIELQLEGELSRVEFEEALHRALQRHPLLNAIILHRLWRRCCWIAFSGQPELHWLTSEQFEAMETPAAIDLTSQPGLRIWASLQPGAPRLILEFHHACVDGVGAIEFIGDLLGFYGRMTARHPDQLPLLDQVDQSRLKYRGMFSAVRHSFWKWFPVHLKSTINNIKTLPIPLSGSENKNGQSEQTTTKRAFPPYLTRILNRRQLKQIKQAAARLGVMPNDLYVAAMMQTFQAWNLSQGSLDADKFIRLCIPISLRTPFHDGSPAANVISHLMLSRTSQELHDIESTVQFVHRTCRESIGDIAGATFVRNIAFYRWFPGWLPRMSRLPICMCTGVVANVGDIRRIFRVRFPQSRGNIVAGNLTLTGLLGAAPIRPKSGAATSVGTYNNRLFINMNYDHELLNEHAANELLDLFIEKLLSMSEFDPNESSDLRLTSPPEVAEMNHV